MKATCEITILSDIGLDGSGFSYWQGQGYLRGTNPVLIFRGFQRCVRFCIIVRQGSKTGETDVFGM
jgi:hypothetical protein